MTRQDICGIIVPVLTPMEADEKIAETALCQEIDRLIEAGVDGIFCLGTNGEAYALSYEEKQQVISATVRHTAKRVPVYAGTGCVTTAETIRLSQFAKSCGADALSVITPYFAAASQEELYRHYCALAEAVEIPTLVYNIPARTGVSVSPELWSRLMQIPSVCGIKDSSGNFSNMLAYLERSKETDAAVLSGNDSLILWNLLAGGQGGIAGCANVYPHTVVEIYRSFLQGDLNRAHRAQRSLSSLRGVFQYGNANTVIKTAAAMLGFPVGACRRPFDHLSETAVQKLQQVLEENRESGMC